MADGAINASQGRVPVDRALFSLVVPTLGRSGDVAVMLRSMITQTDRNLELIIVDQNKSDMLVPIIAEARAGGLEVRHVRLGAAGATLARNAGLAEARGDIIAFPDDDCWYEPDVVARVRRHLAEKPQVAGLLAHWVERDPAGDRPGGALDSAAWRQFKGGDAACFALFFRREALEEVGGFSECFGPGRFFGCAEEEDLILRLMARGARIDYCPDIHIHHFHADEPELSARQCRRSRSYGRGMGGVVAKHKLPGWVMVRGLGGPFYHAARGPKPVAGLLLASCTVLGRIEGMAGWWLWGAREEHGRLAGQTMRGGEKVAGDG